MSLQQDPHIVPDFHFPFAVISDCIKSFNKEDLNVNFGFGIMVAKDLYAEMYII